MMDGGHVEGPEGVRAYWTRQFEEISSTVDPERFESPEDDVVVVTVHQVVRSLDGSEVLSDSTVRHRFTLASVSALVIRRPISDPALTLAPVTAPLRSWLVPTLAAGILVAA
jgi:hypothetical protein